MTTQDESPIANLIEDLGIETATTDAVEEDLNLSDSEKNDTDSTLTDEDVNTETSEETSEDDTETNNSDEVMAKITALEEKQAMAEKRLADKDKYINELKQQIEQGTKQETGATEEVSNEDKLEFWDDPEGYIARLREEIKSDLEQTKELSNMANIRVDESYYARDKEDYLELVNAESITAEFAIDKDFETKFKESSKPYKVAYEHMKAKQSKDKTAEEELEAKILAKHGYSIKKNASTPPSINKIGSSSRGDSKKSSDGFSTVFGSSY